MSNLMKLFGTLMAVVGLVLGVIVLAKPGFLEARGIQLDTAAILLVGGILALGLGGVIDTLRGQRSRAVAETVSAAKVEAPAPAIDVAKAGLVRKPVEAAAVTVGSAAVAAASVASMVEAAAKPVADAKKVDPVQETISALEQAKADVIKSMGGMDSISAPPASTDAPEALAAEAAAAPEAAEEGEEDLYVLEEKVIRGRPARILSDDTVEAETDEGWMRFENLDHLNEYLDSMEEQAT